MTDELIVTSCAVGAACAVGAIGVRLLWAWLAWVFKSNNKKSKRRP